MKFVFSPSHLFISLPQTHTHLLNNTHTHTHTHTHTPLTAPREVSSCSSRATWRYPGRSRNMVFPWNLLNSSLLLPLPPPLTFSPTHAIIHLLITLVQNDNLAARYIYELQQGKGERYLTDQLEVCWRLSSLPEFPWRCS